MLLKCKRIRINNHICLFITPHLLWTEIKTSKIVAIILYFLLNIYFIASVEAYIRKLNRRAILTKDVMVSAMHAGTQKLDFF